MDPIEKRIGKAINCNVICPECLRIEKFEQPLMTVGDREGTIFCPHCDLMFDITVVFDPS